METNLVFFIEDVVLWYCATEIKTKNSISWYDNHQRYFFSIFQLTFYGEYSSFLENTFKFTRSFYVVVAAVLTLKRFSYEKSLHICTGKKSITVVSETNSFVYLNTETKN